MGRMLRLVIASTTCVCVCARRFIGAHRRLATTYSPKLTSFFVCRHVFKGLAFKVCVYGLGLLQYGLRP